MINFIVVDDNRLWRKQVSSIIDKIMIKTNFEYTKKLFEEYDDIFAEYIKQDLENKIFLLDIRTPNMSSLDIARKIRKCDKNAIIIFLTAHEEYSIKILKTIMEVFCLISKKEDIETNLNTTILEILNRISNDKDIIKIITATSIYAIPLEKVLYITTDSKNRKTVIQTELRKLYCNKTLKYFEEEYKNILVKTHKSCLVNINKVIDFDFKEQKIYFNDKITVELLSKKYKDKIKEKVLN